jgi:hypothetical protein
VASFEARSYALSDFVEWHETSKLELSPDFQRRGVWTSTAKSFLVDTILRGKPFPKIIIMQDFIEGRTVRVVVDGQQRLRAILDFYSDSVRISFAHNRKLGGLRYSQLPEEMRQSFLQYPISVDVLFSAPRSELLDIFARINRYTVKLNSQELLNAQYSGFFKSAAFSLGYRYVEYWLSGKVITQQQINRMGEAELASDLLATLCGGFQSNKAVEGFYRRFEEEEGPVFEKAELFETTMAYVGEIYPAGMLRQTSWTRTHLFYSLFCAIAHIIEPFEGIAPSQVGPELLKHPDQLRVALDEVSAEFSQYRNVALTEEMPEALREFLVASNRGTTDRAARLTRNSYIVQTIDRAFA